MIGIDGCSVLFWDQALLNRTAPQLDERLSGFMSEVRLGHSDFA